MRRSSPQKSSRWKNAIHSRSRAYPHFGELNPCACRRQIKDNLVLTGLNLTPRERAARLQKMALEHQAAARRYNEILREERHLTTRGFIIAMVLTSHIFCRIGRHSLISTRRSI